MEEKDRGVGKEGDIEVEKHDSLVVFRILGKGDTIVLRESWWKAWGRCHREQERASGRLEGGGLGRSKMTTCPCLSRTLMICACCLSLFTFNWPGRHTAR